MNEVSYISGVGLQIAIMKNDLDLVAVSLKAGAQVNIVDWLETSSTVLYVPT